MEDKSIAIQLSGIKKRYRLGQIGGGTLQGDLQSWWAKIHGREDPNTKLGQAARLSGTSFMALNGIDLTVYKGEAIGIIGRNGAGKSTLLKLLSRVTAPTEGEIDIYGRVTSMLEVGTGFNAEMTGRENIYMNGAILGMTKAEIDSKMQEIIEFSEVGDFIDTPVKRFSSGMYVKLAFAVAAHLDSEIMILDEVLAVGDAMFQKKCLSRMGDASSKEGKTILYVSHNMATIRQFCKRCIVLNEGKILYDGNVEEAIGFYMQQAVLPDMVEFDISNQFQKYLSPYPKAKMMFVRLKDKEEPKYGFGEPLIFDLTVACRMNTELLSLRFEIRGADDSSVGTSFIFDFAKMQTKEEKTFELRLDTTGLIPGKYHVVLGLFEKNEWGSYTDLDVVERAMGFEIEGGTNELGVTWLMNYWGFIKFRDMKLLAERSS